MTNSIRPVRERDWFIPSLENDLRFYENLHIGGHLGFGRKPALLIIDVQRRTVGELNSTGEADLERFPMSCAPASLDALPRIVQLLNFFRANALPIIYPHVAPKQTTDYGMFSRKVSAVKAVRMDDYMFPTEIEPWPTEIRLPKFHASAFFGTNLISHLIQNDVDTLILTGGTTSGCVRATAVDAVSHNYRVTVVEDAVFDRVFLSHATSLFDIHHKYADVMDCHDVLTKLTSLMSNYDESA